MSRGFDKVRKVHSLGTTFTDLIFVSNEKNDKRKTLVEEIERPNYSTFAKDISRKEREVSSVPVMFVFRTFGFVELSVCNALIQVDRLKVITVISASLMFSRRCRSLIQN